MAILPKIPDIVKTTRENREDIDFNLLATLGIEYGGILNDTNAKVAGKAYYDTTGKKLYKCIANTSINYADAGYFEALSNNDLLGRLNFLSNNKQIPTFSLTKATNMTIGANFFVFGTVLGNLLVITLRADDLKINGNFSAYEAGSVILPFEVKTPTSSRTTITSDAYDFEFSASVSGNKLAIQLGRGSGNNSTLRNASLYSFLTVPLIV